MKRSFLVGIAAAAAASAPIFFQAPAQAACVTAGPLTTQDCTVFNPQTTSTTVDTFGYNDGGVLGATEITGINFWSSILTPSAWTFSPDPIIITDIAYSLDSGMSYITTGINTSISLGSSSSSNNILSGGNITLPGPITADSFKLKFTIPGGLSSSNAGYLTAKVDFNKIGVGPQSQTRSLQSTAFSDTTPTPGPLPLLGAGAAFGFSRRLRSRVRLAA